MTPYGTWQRHSFLASNPALRALIFLNIGVFIFQHLFLALFRYRGMPVEAFFVQYPPATLERAFLPLAASDVPVYARWV